MKRMDDWKRTLGVLAAALGIAALPSGGPVSANGRDHEPATKVFTLQPPTHGSPEGVAYDSRTETFFVGATGDGTIYRGTLRQSTVTEFIPGRPGMEAAGMKVARGKLYVAGGFSGTVPSTTSQQAAGGLVRDRRGRMLNDLVVTKNGDVFVTDSFRPMLWHITAAQVAAGTGAPGRIPVDPEIEYDFGPFVFNLNGIVAMNGGRRLIVVNSNNGKLFRIDLDEDASHGRKIREIAVEPLAGDGLLLDQGHLIVVTFAPASLAFVKLNDRVTQGRVVERRTDPTLEDPRPWPGRGTSIWLSIRTS